MNDASEKNIRTPIPADNISAHIADPVIAIDFRGNVLFWSEGAERVYGRKSDEMLGQPLFRAYQRECQHAERSEDTWDGARWAGSGAGDTLHILPDGRQITVHFEAYPLRDKAGNEIGFVGTVRDVSESLQKETSRTIWERRSPEEGYLRGQELRSDVGVLEISLEDFPASAFVKDDPRRQLYHSRDSQETTLLLQSGIARTSAELCDEEVSQRLQKADLRAMNLSSQKKAEAALREREERFRALAESLPQLIWISDVTGRNEYCNQQLLDYAGLSAEEVKGLSWWGLIHPDDRDSTKEKWQHSLATGETYSHEYRLRRHDGEYRYFLARGVPVRSETGGIAYWVGSCTDVHDQKLVYEAMRRSERLATAGRLSATIAHEINNPLASVSNVLYLVLNDPSLSGTTRQYLKLAEQELKRISHFTTQTLRFHQQPDAPAATDITNIMDSIFAIFGPRFDSASIKVTLEYLSHEKLFCYGDELRQAFASMISNALDATVPGDRVRVRIRQSRARNEAGTPGLRVVIADTGEGIAPRIRTTLFEPFVSTRDRTGTGLGLWVTERVVKKHHGTIRFRSRTGEKHGTVFSLFFPFVGVAE